MDTLLMMTVGSLLTLVAAAAGWCAFLAWHAGRLWSERRHRDELATLRLQLRLRLTDDTRPFVDLADEFDLVNSDAPGHSCCWCGDPDVPCVIEGEEALR